MDIVDRIRRLLIRNIYQEPAGEVQSRHYFGQEATALFELMSEQIARPCEMTAYATTSPVFNVMNWARGRR